MTDLIERILRAKGDSALERELSPEQELAVLARMLHSEGYDDHIFGHLSIRQPDGSLLVNPSNLAWRQVTASDAVRLAPDGTHLAGRRVAPAAIELHLALHRLREDVVVAVHNHPRWATIWAAVGRVPPAYEQIGAFLADEDIAFHRGYQGTVVDPVAAESNVRSLGSHAAALLENHGVFVVGGSVREVFYRCVSLESRSRIAWHVDALGGGRRLPAEEHQVLAARVRKVGVQNLFESAARWEIGRDPDVLS
ncbi:MAG: class II aldolase/adducin family protein [Mycobacterium sp.]|nr:class II aldolase/adducin family protein [Mycobacterium sp.]